MRTYDYLIPLAINNSSTIEINILWYCILYFCKIAMEHCYVIGKFQVNHHNSPAISHWTDVILGLQKKVGIFSPNFPKIAGGLMPSPGSPSPRRECFVGSTPNSWPSDDIFPNNRRKKNTHGWIYNSVDKAKAILFLNLSLNMQLGLISVIATDLQLETILEKV